MTKKSRLGIILSISLLLLTSINLGLFDFQRSIDSTLSVIEHENNLETSDLVYNPFVVGITRDPYSIDPADCLDVVSSMVIEQVCEGLFGYNLSDPDLSRINWLAESYWWEDEITLRLKLREGILFHDNTAFNAAAAKWNLDRINYLTNVSGTLPSTTEVAIPAILWKFPNGTGIMKQIDYVSEYNITIHLNGPYSPFLDLLCVTSAQMISPTSHSQTGYIDLYSGDLIGTGPFQYDEFTPGIEVIFHAFDNYWRGEANITEMQYQVISDSTARNMAMLFGDIDYLFFFHS
jgi:peptide/nickel transport system substrate-binding protein